MNHDKAILTCALTGVLTNPQQHPVPVTPAQMAAQARDAFNAGASIMHVHLRSQAPGLGHLPSWDPDVAASVVGAIRDACPGVIINLTTGVVGTDISGPVACLRRVRPEVAACNAGTLNYLKIKDNGEWAWPPMVFDNPVSKVQAMLDVMRETDTHPEFECFDVGIVRSVGMYLKAGMFGGSAEPPLAAALPSGDGRRAAAALGHRGSAGPPLAAALPSGDGRRAAAALGHGGSAGPPLAAALPSGDGRRAAAALGHRFLPELNFVMGVASGMPCDGALLRLLPGYAPPDAVWQTTLIGRAEIWPVHQLTAELGGMLRSGLEDTFYLPDGTRASGNGVLIEALANCALRAGRGVATPAEARARLGLHAACSQPPSPRSAHRGPTAS